MSILTEQVNNLRLMARLVRDYDCGEISRMLREAADTIESLRDKLQAADKTYNLNDELVRCRDCRYYREEWNRKLMRDTVYCEWLDGSHVEPDGFCAWGERNAD